MPQFEEPDTEAIKRLQSLMTRARITSPGLILAFDKQLDAKLRSRDAELSGRPLDVARRLHLLEDHSQAHELKALHRDL